MGAPELFFLPEPLKIVAGAFQKRPCNLWGLVGLCGPYQGARARAGPGQGRARAGPGQGQGRAGPGQARPGQARPSQARPG